MDTKAGKVTVLTTFLSIFVILLGVLMDIGNGGQIQTASADNATTSVTVLNTAPSWSVDAQEATESSTSTPTNASTTISWNATATDGNGEDFYLIVCATSTPPTPAQSAAPSCAGGAANQYAVSAATTDATQATATYLAQDIDAEVNNWWAFVCDGNAGTPSCNSSYRQGSGNTISPFVVNHRPSFDGYWDDSGTTGHTPGSLATWYSTSTDPDTIRGGDTIRLIVCQANDYSTTTQLCGVGGWYGSSTPAVASNATATSTLSNPLRDTNYTAYGYVVDEFGLTSGGPITGTDSVLTVTNVTPSILTSGVLLSTTSPMAPSVEQGETPGMELSVIISDDNSCLNAASGNEITGIAANVFRSGVGSSSCLVSGDYDPADCYPEAVGAGTWNLSCSQRAGSCLGASDPEVIYDCTFPIWYIADPTDGGSEYPTENWLATVRASDDNFATSTWTEGDTGQEMNQFMAYNVATTAIPYGSLEPGQANTTTGATTTVQSTGNVGLDINLSGLDMCPDTAFPSCSGNPTSTIPVAEQVYATSSVLYAAGTALSGVPTELELNAPKTLATSTPLSADATWAINVPGAITVSGDYVGENTLTGVVGESADW